MPNSFGSGTLLVYVVPLIDGVPDIDLGNAVGFMSVIVNQFFNYAPLMVSGLSVEVHAGDALAMVLAAETKPDGNNAF